MKIKPKEKHEFKTVNNKEHLLNDAGQIVLFLKAVWARFCKGLKTTCHCHVHRYCFRKEILKRILKCAFKLKIYNTTYYSSVASYLY